MKRAALALIASLALTGCAGSEDETTTTSTTTEPDSTKVTIDGVAIDRDNYSDRFELSHQQWMRYLVSIDAGDDGEFALDTTLERPDQTDKAMQMCEDFKAMVEGETEDAPRIEVYGDGGVLLTRVGYSTTRDGCLRL